MTIVTNQYFEYSLLPLGVIRIDGVDLGVVVDHGGQDAVAVLPVFVRARNGQSPCGQARNGPN